MLNKPSPLKHNEVAEELPHDTLTKQEHSRKQGGTSTTNAQKYKHLDKKDFMQSRGVCVEKILTKKLINSNV